MRKVKCPTKYGNFEVRETWVRIDISGKFKKQNFSETLKLILGKMWTHFWQTSPNMILITWGIRKKILSWKYVKFLAYLLFKTLILMIWNIEQNVSHSSVLVCWCWLFILGKGTRPHLRSQPGKAIVRNNDDVKADAM